MDLSKIAPFSERPMFHENTCQRRIVIKNVFSEVVPVIDNSSHQLKKERLEATLKVPIDDFGNSFGNGFREPEKQPDDAGEYLKPLLYGHSDTTLQLFLITSEAPDSPISILLDSFPSSTDSNRIAKFQDQPSESQPSASSAQWPHQNAHSNSPLASRRASRTAQSYAVNRLTRIIRSDRDDIAAIQGKSVS